MNPDLTIICRKCHQPVVRAENLQGVAVTLEPAEKAYVYRKIGVKIMAQRVDYVGVKHQCPAEKGK